MRKLLQLFLVFLVLVATAQASEKKNYRIGHVSTVGHQTSIKYSPWLDSRTARSLATREKINNPRTERWLEKKRRLFGIPLPNKRIELMSGTGAARLPNVFKRNR